jgi:hypothetical protein
MPNIQEVLGRKLGPLPVGVWILAVGGGLGLSYYMQSRVGEEGEEGAEEEVPFGDTFDPQPFPNYGGGISLPDYGTVGPIASQPQAPTTNNEWHMLVVEYLIRTGTNALKAQNAITKYLEGKLLTGEEQAMVSTGIRQFGVPPEGAPSLEPDTPPVVDPPDTPTGPRFGSAVPADVKATYNVASVGAVVKSLGINWDVNQVLSVGEMTSALTKLGWRSAGDLAITVRNVGRLLQKQRPPTKPTGYVWHSSVPSNITTRFDVRTVIGSLRALKAVPTTRFISTRHVRTGLWKLGYRKTLNLRGTDPRNVQRLIDRRRARKGE